MKIFDNLTKKLLFFLVVTLFAIPYYFLSGGTLLGFIIIRAVSTFFGFCGQVGWHRWLTHNSFEPSAIGRFLMFCGILFNGYGRPMNLVVSHIHHHRYSDNEGDPHSPKHHTFFKLLTGQYSNLTKGVIVPRQFLRDKSLAFFDKHYWVIFWIFNILFCFVDLKTALVFCPVSIVYSWVLVTAVNYFGHRYQNNIGPRNLDSRILVFLSGGEGLHKNHHDSPSNYSFSGGTRFDIGAVFVKYILQKRVLPK